MFAIARGKYVKMWLL